MGNKKQMLAKGKVAGDDVRQLAEAGVPVWQILAEATGKSTAELIKLSEKGLLPAKESIDVLIDGMEKKFPNMMEKQSHTFNGLMSTVHDNMSQILGSITQQGFKKLEDGLASLTKKTTQFLQILQTKGLHEAMVEMFPPEIVKTMDMLKDGFSWFIKHLPEVLTAVKYLTAAWAGYKIGIGLSTAVTLGLEIAEKAVTAATWLWDAAMTALDALMDMNPIGATILVVGALSGAIITLTGHWDDVTNAIKKAFKALSDFLGLSPMIDAVGNAFNKFKSWLGFGDNAVPYKTTGSVGDLFSNGKYDPTISLKSGFSDKTKSLSTDITGSINKALDEAGKKSQSKAKETGTKTGKTAGKALLDAIANQTSTDKDKIVSSINNLNDQVIESLRNRYQEEEDLQSNSINKQIDKLSDWKEKQLDAIEAIYKKRKDTEDANTDKFIKNKQKEIDAIDKQIDTEDREKTNKSETENIQKLQKELEKEYDPEKQAEIQQEINDAIANREARLQRQKLEDKKTKLNAEIDAERDKNQKVQDSLDKKEDAEKKKVENTYNYKKKVLDNELTAVKDHYTKLLKEANIYAESARLIQSGSQRKIISLIKSYGNQYSLAGNDLGTRLVNGFKPHVAELADSVKNALNGVTSSNIVVSSSSKKNSKKSSSPKIADNTTGTKNNKGVKWHAQGAIYNSPAIVGVGDVAGGEAIIPINKLSSILADTLKNIGGGNKGIPIAVMQVENLTVRNENDINKINTSLYDMNMRFLRASGKR